MLLKAETRDKKLESNFINKQYKKLETMYFCMKRSEKNKQETRILSSGELKTATTKTNVNFCKYI